MRRPGVLFDALDEPSPTCSACGDTVPFGRMINCRKCGVFGYEDESEQRTGYRTDYFTYKTYPCIEYYHARCAPPKPTIAKGCLSFGLLS